MVKTEKKKTSFDIDEKLWQEFRIQAMKENISASELLERIIKKTVGRK